MIQVITFFSVWTLVTWFLIRRRSKQQIELHAHPLRLLLIRAAVQLSWAAYRMQSGVADDRAAESSRSLVMEIKKELNWEPNEAVDVLRL